MPRQALSRPSLAKNRGMATTVSGGRQVSDPISLALSDPLAPIGRLGAQGTGGWGSRLRTLPLLTRFNIAPV